MTDEKVCETCGQVVPETPEGGDAPAEGGEE